MRVIGVRRALRFSPNNEEKDLAILRSVVAPWDGEIILEEDPSLPELLTTATVVFSMARTSWALSCLDEAERLGVSVLNPPEGVRRCARSVLQRLAAASSVPVPPREGTAGWWLKRGDAAAQSRADVVFCPDRPALDRALADFRSRGIDDYLIQAHLPGDIVKFYGVLSTGFFRFFYPGDDGQSKFGDESHNGRPHHYAFSQYDLHAAAPDWPPRPVAPSTAAMLSSVPTDPSSSSTSTTGPASPAADQRPPRPYASWPRKRKRLHTEDNIKYEVDIICGSSGK